MPKNAVPHQRKTQTRAGAVEKAKAVQVRAVEAKALVKAKAGKAKAERAVAAAKAADASRLPQTAPLSKYKVVFLGDQGTGKTSIIKAFMYGSFDHNYQVSQWRCGGAALPLHHKPARAAV